MKVVDLHPEELLDKDARGELSTDERVRLETHLARCSACRAERVLRLDFADELDGDDRPSALLDLVQGALAAPRPVVTTADAEHADVAESLRTSADESGAPVDDHARAPKAMPELDAGPGLRRRPRRTAFVLLVAAAVLAASAAGATGMTSRVWSSLRGGSLETTHASATASPAAAATLSPAGARNPALALGAPAPSAEEIPEPAVTAAPVEGAPLVVEPVFAVAPTPASASAFTATPSPAVALAPARAFVPALAVAPAPAAFNASPTATTAAPATAPVAAPVPTTASGLFESANTARRSGDTMTALARYDALEAQFPATREARVAKATTGKLLLDRGDSVGALARFDAYIASGSSELREEAMAGRATALERLGRGDEEARAWSALVATYPATPYGTHARSRIAASPRGSLPR
jgi:hypothetical protein